MNNTVAIQGVKGSFHYQVAQDYYRNDILVDECLSFDKLVDSLIDGQAHQAVMAIENSIAGSIIPNYALIDKHQLHIIGEYYLNIHHNLLALKGQQIKDIKEVCSHPMALLQCKDFFRKHPHIKLVEDADTAEVAQRIQKNQIKGIAAIAGNAAASLYELDILAPSIQTIQDNSTRFVIVQTSNSVIPKKEISKASLKFMTDHKRGSLATVLNVMSDCKLNLTKIQSLPVIETPWKYAFFVDITFDDYEDYDKAKNILQLMTYDFKILGEYKNARS
ncbi:prephenate dehydratase [Spongiivirga citrea]|uniref:prephenate dehydratase n=1 Tax=Spongiivirga citrea TaxID=1481457 RepID=A0A6M0CSA2_9FLAO|nr:prephenate dehydratase [Spongiivirga citrea]NER18799.1 prephenate dehydratase [Spongiivirga citrea]